MPNPVNADEASQGVQHDDRNRQRAARPHRPLYQPQTTVLGHDEADDAGDDFAAVADDKLFHPVVEAGSRVRLERPWRCT